MNIDSLRDKITAYLAQQHDPVGIVQDKLYSAGLHVSDVEHSEVYTVLKQITPVSTPGGYRGDAIEFLRAELHPPYDSLRDLVAQLGDLLGERPFEGESIVVYINRLVTSTVKHIFEDKE